MSDPTNPGRVRGLFRRAVDAVWGPTQDDLDLDRAAEARRLASLSDGELLAEARRILGEAGVPAERVDATRLDDGRVAVVIDEGPTPVLHTHNVVLNERPEIPTYAEIQVERREAVARAATMTPEAQVVDWQDFELTWDDLTPEAKDHASDRYPDDRAVQRYLDQKGADQAAKYGKDLAAAVGADLEEGLTPDVSGQDLAQAGPHLSRESLETLVVLQADELDKRGQELARARLESAARLRELVQHDPAYEARSTDEDQAEIVTDDDLAQAEVAEVLAWPVDDRTGVAYDPAVNAWGVWSAPRGKLDEAKLVGTHVGGAKAGGDADLQWDALDRERYGDLDPAGRPKVDIWVESVDDEAYAKARDAAHEEHEVRQAEDAAEAYANSDHEVDEALDAAELDPRNPRNVLTSDAQYGWGDPAVRNAVQETIRAEAKRQAEVEELSRIRPKARTERVNADELRLSL